MFFNILVVFLLVFSFPVVGPLNSVLLAIFLALFNIVKKNRLNRVVQLFKNKYLRLLLGSTIGMAILSALWTNILSAGDSSFTAAFISLFIGIFLVIIVTASLNFIKFDNEFVEKLLVDVFVVQGIISICAFISPTVKEIVHHFQFDETVISDDYYIIFRGLAVSGRLFFELAATCGLITIVQFKRIATNNNVSFLEYIKLFVVIICGFFAGRTSMIGIAFGFVYLLMYKSSFKSKIKIVAKIFGIILCVVFIALIILPNSIIHLFTDVLFPWLFDLFIKYEETGTTETSASFNMLNEMYKFVEITPDEWIYGSGRYVDGYGGYYKSVDGGYIRVLLYWGLIGSIISSIYGLLYFIKPYKLCKSKNDKLFIFLIFVYTFFIHYKGEIAITSRFYHVPLIMLMLPYTFNKIKKIKNGINRHRNSVG